MLIIDNEYQLQQNTREVQPMIYKKIKRKTITTLLFTAVLLVIAI